MPLPFIVMMEEYFDIEEEGLQTESFTEEEPVFDIAYHDDSYSYAPKKDTSGRGRKQVQYRHSRKDVYYDRNGKQHGRGRNRSRERRGGVRVHGFRRTLLILALSLVVIAALSFGAWKTINAFGKRVLLQRGAGMPTLAEVETKEMAAAKKQEKRWEPGWVRYKGDIYEYKSDIMTFLLMGVDRKEKAIPVANRTEGGQADSLFLLIMDPETKEISVLAINRNTMTDVDVYDADGVYVGKDTMQISLQHGYGDGTAESCERQVQAVSNLLYKIPVSGYAAINLGGIIPLNDAAGGVTLTTLREVPVRGVDEDGNAASGTYQTLPANAKVTLDGEEAYWYVRYRNTKENFTADERLERQKQYMAALLAKMKTVVKENPSTAVSLYRALSPYMVTNLSAAEVTYLAGEVGGYRLNLDEIYALEGESVLTEDNYAEYYHDDKALYDLMIRLFYKKVDLGGTGDANP